MRERSLLVQKINKFSLLLLFLILLFLPTQVGKHFWPTWSFVSGQRVDYLSPTLYLTDVCILVLFSMQGLLFIRSVWYVVVGTLVILGLGLLVSLSPIALLFGIAKIVEVIFLGWFIARHTKQTISFLQWVFPLGIVIESILALWQFLLQHSVGGLWYFLGERNFTASTPGIANASLNGQLVLRPYATFSHPNILAGFLLISLVFLVVIGSVQNRIYRFFTFFAVGIGCFCLLLTLSRTAIILGIVLGCFYVVQRIRAHKKYIAAVSIAASMAFVIGLLILAPRFATLTSTDESVILREKLIAASWSMFLHSPLVGVGVNNFFSHLPLISPLLPLQPVHNILLLVLVQAGTLGFICFLIALFFTIKHVLALPFESRFWKNIRTFCLCGLGLYLAIGMVDHYFFTLQQGQLLTALLFGLSWAKVNA